MAAPTAPPLPPGCPWSGFTPPNVDWCEVEHCGWVVNPSDTWSNALYVVLGVVMIVQARRRGSRALALFGPASIFVGLSSGIYHASYTWLFQFFDFVGMFVFTFLVIALNARRLGWIAARHQTLLFAAGVVGASALVPPLFAVGFPIQATVLVLILGIVGQEWLARARQGPHPARRYFALGLVLIGAGAVASLLDVTRVWCDPDALLQGHAVWHLLSAASLYALFLFYARLDLDAAVA